MGITRKKWFQWLLTSWLILSLCGCTLLKSPSAPITVDNVNLLLGNPSQATPDRSNSDNYLIVRPQYVLAYNRSQGIANWASWQLNASWLGTLSRPPFTPDLSLPVGWYQVAANDYTGSGFDRGHLVPAADRNQTPTDSQAVFLMSNIFPQAPDNNQGPWEKLESYCRKLVRSGKELYIVAGTAGSGGSGKNGLARAIAKGQVVVPAKTWKAIAILDHPGMGLQDISPSTPVIAVIMPNQQGIKESDWRSFRTSVREIETLTGYDLFSNLPEAVQAAIENKSSDQ